MQARIRELTDPIRTIKFIRNFPIAVTVKIIPDEFIDIEW